jgi:hypothetical protein
MLHFLFHLHSGLRWILVLLAFTAFIKYLIGWIAKHKYSRFDAVLMTSFRILVDIQILIGIIMFIGMGVFFGFPFYHFMHALSMIVALIIIHATAHRWDEIPSEKHYRNSFLMIMAVSVIIAAGVAFLPQGWTFVQNYIPK